MSRRFTIRLPTILRFAFSGPMSWMPKPLLRISVKPKGEIHFSSSSKCLTLIRKRGFGIQLIGPENAKRKIVGNLIVNRLDIQMFLEAVELNIKGKTDSSEKMFGVVSKGELLKMERILFQLKEKIAFVFFRVLQFLKLILLHGEGFPKLNSFDRIRQMDDERYIGAVGQ